MIGVPDRKYEAWLTLRVCKERRNGFKIFAALWVFGLKADCDMAYAEGALPHGR